MADSSTQPCTQLSQQTPTDLVTDPSGNLENSVYGILVPSDTANARMPVSLRNSHKVYTFGRKPECNDIVLSDSEKVSNVHFKIILIEPATSSSVPIVMVEDCSTNGTYVNGRRIGKAKRCVLKHGDEISLGHGKGIPDIRYIYRHNIPFSLSQEEQAEGIRAKYDFEAVIGKGAFATVHRVINKVEGSLRACKVIEKRKFFTNSSAPKMFQREVEILRQLQHPNIISYVDYYENDETIYIIMEMASGGDMLDYITRKRGLDEDETIRLMRQVFLAIKYTHSLSITHRDLKPDNILLTGGTMPMAKITDFGLAKAVDNATFLKTVCGTPTYLAPEIIRNNGRSPYSEAVDAWSLGVITYCALANTPPFVDGPDIDIFTKIVNRKISFAPLQARGCSLQALDFIDHLLVIEPTQRMTVTQALNHEWLRQSEEDIDCMNNMTDEDSFVTRENTGMSFFDVKINGLVSPAAEMDDPFATLSTGRKRPLSQVGSRSLSPFQFPSFSNPISTLPDKMVVDGDNINDYVNANEDNDPIAPYWVVLRFKSGRIETRNFKLQFDTSDFCVYIGRAKDNSIIINDSRISKYHCNLWKEGDRVKIKDTSLNGIFVNDTKLGKNAVRDLEDCDEISLFQLPYAEENVVYVFHKWSDLTLEQKYDDYHLIQPFSAILDSPSSTNKRQRVIWAKLTGINPAFPGAVLTQAVTTIGRDASCSENFVFEYPKISAHHCNIVKEGENVYIIDVSSNGTFQNGNRLPRGKRCKLQSGDDIVFVYAEDSEPDVQQHLCEVGALDKSLRPVLIGFVYTLL